MNLTILNLHRAGDIEERCRTLTPAEAVCIAAAEADTRAWSCDDCAYFGSDSDGGEPEYSVSWPICEKRPQLNNLKSFPFKRAPRRCFVLGFWASAYAGILDGSETSHETACKLSAAADDYGRPPAPAARQHPEGEPK